MLMRLALLAACWCCSALGFSPSKPRSLASRDTIVPPVLAAAPEASGAAAEARAAGVVGAGAAGGVEALSFRELQRMAKSLGIPATGSAAVLRARIIESSSQEAASEAEGESSQEAACEADDDLMLGLLAEAAKRPAAVAAHDVEQPDDGDDEILLAEMVLLDGGEKNKKAEVEEEAVLATRESRAKDPRVGAATATRALAARRGRDVENGLQAARNAGDVNLAKKIILSLPNATSAEWTTALGAYAKARRNEDADALTSEAHAAGRLPAQKSGALYRALLKAAVGGGNWRKANALLTEMRSDDSVRVDLADYEYAVFAAERANFLATTSTTGAAKRGGSPDQATAKAPWQALTAMKKHGFEPTPRCLVAVANAARFAARTDLALAALQALHEHIQPQSNDDLADWEIKYLEEAAVATLDSVRRAALAARAPPRRRDDPVDPKLEALRDAYAGSATKVLREFFFFAGEESRLPASLTEEDVERAYVTAATGCARWLRPEAGYEILRLAKTRAALGLNDWPSINLFNVVLDGFAAAGFDRRASVFLEEIEASPNIEFDPVTYNICLRVCVKSSDHARAELLLEEMAQSNIKADVVSYTTAIRCCCMKPPLMNHNVGKQGAASFEASAQTAVRILKKALKAEETNAVTVRTALRACLGAPAERPRPQRDAVLGLEVLRLIAEHGKKAQLDTDLETTQRLRAAAGRLANSDPNLAVYMETLAAFGL